MHFKDFYGEGHSWELSLSELGGLAGSLWQALAAGDWVYLDGDLGAGKTHFVQALLRQAGAQEAPSPTFPIISVVELPASKTDVKNVVHCDFYRLKSGKELPWLGLQDVWNPRKSVLLIEWPERVEEEEWEEFFQMTGCQTPKKEWHVFITGIGEKRTYQIRSVQKS